MKKLAALLVLLVSTLSLAAFTPRLIQLGDEGTALGYIGQLNCVGSGIACTIAGTRVGTITYTAPSAMTVGELYESNAGGTAIAVTSTGVFYQWVSSTTGTCTGTTCSAATDNVTIGTAGTYLVNASMGLVGDAGKVITMAVHVDGAEKTNCEALRAETTPNVARQNLATSCVLVLAAEAVVDLRITENQNIGTVTVYQANLNVAQVR